MIEEQAQVFVVKEKLLLPILKAVAHYTLLEVLHVVAYSTQRLSIPAATTAAAAAAAIQQSPL
jgi:hypothetical protein